MGNCSRRQEPAQDVLFLTTRGSGPVGRARVLRRESDARVNYIDARWVRFALHLALRRRVVVVVVPRVFPADQAEWPEGEEEAARWSGHDERLSLANDY